MMAKMCIRVFSIAGFIVRQTKDYKGFVIIMCFIKFYYMLLNGLLEVF